MLELTPATTYWRKAGSVLGCQVGHQQIRMGSVNNRALAHDHRVKLSHSADADGRPEGHSLCARAYRMLRVCSCKQTTCEVLTRLGSRVDRFGRILTGDRDVGITGQHDPHPHHHDHLKHRL